MLELYASTVRLCIYYSDNYDLTLTLFTVYTIAQLCHGITAACQVVHAWRASEVTTAGRYGVHYIYRHCIDHRHALPWIYTI